MPYAVVQRSLAAPEMDRLEQAFADTPGITLPDARFALRHNTGGILMAGLSEEIAERLAQSLNSGGVEAVAIDESGLVRPPLSKHLRRADFKNEILAAYDSMGREYVIPWPALAIIAAANLPETDVKIENLFVKDRVGQTVVMPRKHEKNVFRPTLVLVTGDGVEFFEIQADTFGYQCLGDQASPRREENFLNLVRELIRRAPAAALNRGAAGSPDSATVQEYPSRRAFEQEIVWLLWWVKQR